jgi:hypothetical protein
MPPLVDRSIVACAVVIADGDGPARGDGVS